MKFHGLIKLLYFFVLTNTLTGQSDQVTEISKILHRFYSQFPQEKIWFIPSMNVAEPGSKIPFAAIISRDPLNATTRLSRSLFLKLYDEQGQPVFLVQERLQEDLYVGELIIPENIEPGRYTLYAYTSWMKNENPEYLEAFPIYITRETNPEYEIRLRASSTIISAEIPLQAEVMLVSWKDGLPASTPVAVELTVGRKKIYGEKIQADKDGKVQLSVSVSPGITGDGALTVTSTIKGKKIIARLPIRVSGNPVNAEFYPESGTLVQGVSNNIKVTLTLDSVPVEVMSGEITDNTGTFLGLAKPISKGNAIFSITPREGKSYFLTCKLANGQKKTFPIPVSRKGVLVRMQDYTDQTVRFALIKTPGFECGKLFFILESNGFIYNFVQAEPGQLISVPVEDIPAGLARAIVFDEKGELCAERWFTIKGNSLLVENRTACSSDGNSLEVSFRLTDPDGKEVPGSVLMAVTAIVSWSEPNVYRQFHTSPVLIPPMSNMLAFADSSSWKKTDLFLCGYSHPLLSWRFIADRPGKILPYESQDFLAGYLLDNNGKVLSGTRVVMKTAGGKTTEKVTNDKGYFRFDPFVPEPGGSISVYAPELAGRKHYKFQWDAPFDKQLNQVARKNCWLDPFASSRFYNAGRSGYGKVAEPLVPANVSSDFPKYPPSLSILEIIRQKRNYQIINNQIVFGSPNSFYSQQGALIVIDGVPFGTDISILQQIPTEDVENINVSTNVNDIHKYTALNSIGIIEITTRKGVSQAPSVKTRAKSSFFYYWEPLIQTGDKTLVRNIALPAGIRKGVVILNAFDPQGRNSIQVADFSDCR